MPFHKEDQYIHWMEELADDDYVVLDEFIDASVFNSLYRYIKDRKDEDDLKNAGIGTLGDHTIDKEIRGDFVYWLDRDRDTELEAFYLRVD